MKHHRDFLAWLRDEYAVADALVTPGGKHAALTFTYAGRPRRATLPLSPGDLNWLRVKKRDLRAELGPAPAAPDQPRRTLEEMTPMLSNGAAEMPTLQDELAKVVSKIKYPDAKPASQRYRLVTDVLAALEMHGPRTTTELYEDLRPLAYGQLAFESEAKGRSWLAARLAMELGSPHPRLMRDDEGNWRAAKPGPNWVTPVDTGAMKVGDRIVSPSIPELDGGRIVAVSKVRRPVNLVPVAEVEPLRAELGLDPQEFSLALGYSRGAYAEMLRDGHARPVVLLTAEALVRRRREAAPEPDDELRRVLAAVRRIESTSDYRLVRTKHNGEEKLVWRAEVA